MYYPELSHQYPIHNLINGRQEKDFGLQEWPVVQGSTMFKLCSTLQIQNISKFLKEDCTHVQTLLRQTLRQTLDLNRSILLNIATILRGIKEHTGSAHNTGSGRQLVPDFPLPNDSVDRLQQQLEPHGDMHRKAQRFAKTVPTSTEEMPYSLCPGCVEIFIQCNLLKPGVSLPPLVQSQNQRCSKHRSVSVMLAK